MVLKKWKDSQRRIMWTKSGELIEFNLLGIYGTRRWKKTARKFRSFDIKLRN